MTVTIRFNHFQNDNKRNICLILQIGPELRKSTDHVQTL